MMLLGMALYKWGILSAQRSNQFYAKMILIGLIVGYAIITAGVYQNFQHVWFMDYSMFIGNQFNYVGSVLVALGYIGIIMIICRSDQLIQFKKLLASVGKMAFTNYILMSVLGMFIFYGNGLGLYGQVERSIQILIVFAIWILLLIISPLWLQKYRYGPLEWLWRMLSYWRKQPMIIEN